MKTIKLSTGVTTTIIKGIVKVSAAKRVFESKIKTK